jgi:hypothetical protein
VPYRVDGGSLIYATQDVRDLINHLTAVDDPTDDIAVVSTLRSPAYACSDVEFAEHKLGGRTFNYLAPGLENLEGRVASGLLDLRALHLSRGGSLAAMVARIVGSHRTVEAGIYDTGNRNAFRRVRFVIEQARTFEADQPQSLRALVEWFERRAADAIMDQEGSGLDDDEDAVRVLTIHGSKGLEFPIVIVAGLGSAPNTKPAILSVDRTSSTVAVSIGARGRGNFTLGTVDELVAQEALHLQAERDRLLYVAATRARDHLLLSLYHRVRAQNTAAQRLIEARACELAAELPELPAAISDAHRVPFSDLHVESSDFDDVAFGVERDELVDSASRFRVTSATALRGCASPTNRSARTRPSRGRVDEQARIAAARSTRPSRCCPGTRTRRPFKRSRKPRPWRKPFPTRRAASPSCSSARWGLRPPPGRDTRAARSARWRSQLLTVTLPSRASSTCFWKTKTEWRSSTGKPMRCHPRRFPAESRTTCSKPGYTCSESKPPSVGRSSVSHMCLSAQVRKLRQAFQPTWLAEPANDYTILNCLKDDRPLAHACDARRSIYESPDQLS